MTRILVVDDSELSRRMLQDLLESHGYQLVLAKDGTEALEIARRDPPDLVISDVLMPEMDGFALCRLWNKDERLKHIPLIFYSASYTDPRDEELALNLGAARFINKSIASEVFMRMLREVLGEYETGRLVAPREPAVEEMVFYRKYNEALIRRLEDKMLDSERANRALERELTERKRAEEALRESEQKFRAVVEQSADGILLVDMDTKRIIEANPALAQMLGYSSEEILRLSIYDIVAADREDVDRRIEAVLTAEAPFYERQYRRKDGSVVDAWVSAKVISYGGREVMSTIARDVTERKRAEQALQQSEAKFRTLAETAAAAIFIYRQRFLYLNSAGSLLTGYTLEEARTLDFWEVVHPDFRELARGRGLSRLRGETTPSRYEFKIITKAGEERWVDFTAGMIEYEGQQAILGTAYDITEREKAEEALRESEQKFRALVEQSPDGICLIDVDTRRIVEANPAFAQMLGYSSEEILRLSIYDFFPEDREDVDRRFQERMEGKGLSSFEREYHQKDGSLATIWVSFSPILYGGRKVMCAVLRDLTEKKALEAQFLRAQRMESIGLLAGGISHDLNNILTPILMNAELLRPRFSDLLSQKMLSSISSNARRGADIVRQILAFARGMEGEYLLISPQYLLTEMQRFARETFPKTIAIETEIPPDLWPLSGDAAQLQQVLMNLSINAKDAMSQGGTLTLSATNFSTDEAYARMYPEAKAGPYVVFSVEDTGSGIPPSRLEKIFDPFFTTKERGQGTGLGLSIVHAIVKSHGGFVRVHSEEGRGTKFLVMLPASPSAEMAEAEKEKPPLPAGNGELILVVEDEASIREIAQATLETYGYRVIPAEDGSEAVAFYALHREKIQVVITDMAMPIMDGAATIRALQKMNPAVKIIASSGMDAERMVAETPGLKVKAFLQKPFTAERLLRTLAEVLGLGSVEQ